MPFEEKTRILAELSRLRGNRQMHGWLLASAAAASLLSVVTSFAYAPRAFQLGETVETVVEQLAQPARIVARKADAVYSSEDRVRSGDTIATLMRRLGVDDPQADAFFRRDSVGMLFQTRLRAGQTVRARFGEDGLLQSFSYPLPGTDRALVLDRTGNDLTATEKPLDLETRVQARSGVIHSSLFAAADDVGLPDEVAIQMAEVFGAEIDFHTDLRRGDRFSVIYEGRRHNGHEVKAGRILAAEFINDGVTRRAIWFDGGNGVSGYYTPEGQSLKKAFLRSPLEFSRISSGFSMRFHPILREWRAHKGVDYAAPMGTKVLATADGTVEFIGQQRGYGNFVVLRHHDRYTTAYGHLNGFASGLRKGSRVEQGDVIGYVGRTGWATGPHLHYEFVLDGIHRDPRTVPLPKVEPLGPELLLDFQLKAAPMLTQLSRLESASLYAQRQ